MRATAFPADLPLVEPDTRRSGWGQRFSDPALEAAFRHEQAGRAGAALADSGNAALLLLLIAAFGLVVLLDTRAGHPILILLGLAGLGIIVLRVASAWGMGHPALMGGWVAILTVASPVVLASSGHQTVVLRYGYAGLMLASILLFLLLRLPPAVGLAINLAAIAAYGVILAGLDWFPPPDGVMHLAHAVFALIACVAGGRSLERLARETFAQRAMLAWREAETRRERERSEALLLNVMPAAIAERLKAGESPLADSHAEVAVLFADIVGFTPLADRVPAAELVALLDRLFTGFDELAAAEGIEKIKTIGDAYMAVAGVPLPRADPVAAIARLALRMRAAAAEVSAEEGYRLELRIGIDTGPAVAGVIGRRKFAYDLWGEVVNMASRMESHGAPSRIQVTQAVADRLPAGFLLEDRGVIPVKGVEPMRTFWLEAERG